LLAAHPPNPPAEVALGFAGTTPPHPPFARGGKLWLVRSEIHAMVLATAGTSASWGQVDGPKAPTEVHSGAAVRVGTEVVLSSSSSANDCRRLAGGKIRPPLVVDRVEADRVLIASRHRKRQEWVPRAHVVPFGQAIDDLTREIARNPNDFQPRARRAQLWTDHGDDDAARADLDQAIRLAPLEPWLYVRRSAILLRQQLLEPALADCNKAIELAPNDELAFLNRARVWASSTEYQRVLADLDLAVRIDPTNPYAWGERSQYWRRERNFDKALSDINEAIRLSPDDATLRSWRAKICSDKDDLDRAIAEFDEALRLDPEDAASFEGRAQAYRKKGDFDRAVADATEAVDLDPKQSRLYLLRGEARYRQEEFDKAIADDTEAIRLDPKSAFAFACRAQSWRGKHEREKEAGDYTEAIKLEPQSVLYRLCRANSWSAQGRHALAIADYDAVLRLEHNNSELYVARGIEWRKDAEAGRSEPTQALADFQRAIELDPSNELAYFERAQVWKHKLEFDKVIREFSELIERYPRSSLAHESLGRLFATCGLPWIRDGKRAVSFATRACELTGWKDPDCLDTLAAAYAEVRDFDSAVKWECRAIELLPKSSISGFDHRIAFEGRRFLYASKKPCRE
jgi:tetratricopeptide (TPR) repeat protein